MSGDLKSYIGTKIVHAEPMACPADVHNSKKGDPGYKVVYKDGYESWSPKDVFEEAYHLIQYEVMNFSDALAWAKLGKKIFRHGWNGKNMWVAVQMPDKGSMNTLPYLYIEYPKGHPAYPKGSRVPWLASQTDLLADDWDLI